MRDLQNKIINFLTNGQGFVMESYYSSTRESSNYLAIKSLPKGDYVILITDENNNKADTDEAISYLMSRGKTFSFHKIILTNNNFYNDSYDIYKKVVVDVNNLQVIKCDEGCELIAQIVNIVMPNKYKKPSIKNNYKDYMATYILIAANVIMFLISVLMSRSLISIDVGTLYKLGANNTLLVNYYHQFWRLVTCMFLHGGIIHILCNMYALYYLGMQIEKIFGKTKFIAIYFISGIAASYLSNMFNDYRVISEGASGAIFGLLGALLVYYIKERNRISKGAIENIAVIIVLNLFIGFSSSNIDNFAHIGGLIFGIIISFILTTFNSKKQGFRR